MLKIVILIALFAIAIFFPYIPIPFALGVFFLSSFARDTTMSKVIGRLLILLLVSAIAAAVTVFSRSGIFFRNKYDFWDTRETKGSVSSIKKLLPDALKQFTIHFVLFAMVTIIPSIALGPYYEDGGTFKVRLFALIVIPAIVFLILIKVSPKLANRAVDRIVHEEIEAERQAEAERIAAERAALEAQRQAAAAAAEAKRKAERAEAERKQKEAEAKQAAKKKAERDRQIALNKGVKDFWSLVVKQYGAPSVCLDISKNGFRNFDPAEQARDEEKCQAKERTEFFYDNDFVPHQKADAVKRIWVANDERIAAIEAVLEASDICTRDELVKQPCPFIYSFKQRFDECGDTCFIWHFDSYCYERGLPADISLYPNLENGKQLHSLYWERMVDFYNEKASEMDRLFVERLQYYFKEYKIIKSGLDGEKAVQDVLDMHAGAFYVLHDLRLEFPERNGSVISIETDTLVLSAYGIFAIEVKNYGASGKYKIVVTGDGNWYKEYTRSKEIEKVSQYGEIRKQIVSETIKEPMSNPYEQNDRHIAYLERYLSEVLGRDMTNWVHVENIIVLANNQVEIQNDPAAKQTLTRVSNLYNHLTQNRTQLFTLEELDKVKAALETSRLPSKKYPMFDYRNELQGIVASYRQLRYSAELTKQAMMNCLTDHPEFFKIH